MSVSFTLFKHSEDSFLAALDEQGIQYESRKVPPGQVMASGAWIEIAQAVASSTAVAGILVAWIKARASRRILITKQNGQSVHLEGYSVADVEKILAMAIRVDIIDTKPSDMTSNQTPVIDGDDSLTKIETTSTSSKLMQQGDS